MSDDIQRIQVPHPNQPDETFEVAIEVLTPDEAGIEVTDDLPLKAQHAREASRTLEAREAACPLV